MSDLAIPAPLPEQAPVGEMPTEWGSSSPAGDYAADAFNDLAVGAGESETADLWDEFLDSESGFDQTETGVMDDFAEDSDLDAETEGEPGTEAEPEFDLSSPEGDVRLDLDQSGERAGEPEQSADVARDGLSQDWRDTGDSIDEQSKQGRAGETGQENQADNERRSSPEVSSPGDNEASRGEQPPSQEGKPGVEPPESRKKGNKPHGPRPGLSDWSPPTDFRKYFDVRTGGGGGRSSARRSGLSNFQQWQKEIRARRAAFDAAIDWNRAAIARSRSRDPALPGRGR